jgi:predicted flap endonuclease-1-like 5' DNA nuclease
MSRTNVAPSEDTRTDPQIGHVVADQRTGELRLILYVDDRVVLTRDETNGTTLTPRGAFEAALGSRYRLRRDADPAIDGGQYDSLRDRLAEFGARDGRKAGHKVAAIEEALDIVTGSAEAVPGDGAAAGDGTGDGDSAGENPGDGAEAGTGGAADKRDPEVDFEAVPGIGPETAGKLRTQGFVTPEDGRSASDEALLGVSGVGPAALEALREHLS